MLRASRTASSRESSSRQALSGPDSSQHARQRAPQRLVSCQARKRGARYSSTVRPAFKESSGISGEPDVRLRHHLLGNVLELGRFPRRLLRGLGLFGLDLVGALRRFDCDVRNGEERRPDQEDRKSTRLNSSHPSISYAVFCLKKKTEASPLSTPYSQ